MVTLGGVATVATVLVLGLAYAVWQAMAGLGEDETGPVTSTMPDVAGAGHQGVERRDEIAAAPMLQVPERAMEPGGGQSTQTPKKIQIPPASTPGPASVLTGFPHTPEGAVGQLASIDIAVLQTMTLQTARDVYRAWALPGGVGVDHWAITASVEKFLTAAGSNASADPRLVVTVEPAAALVKGTDGPDWVAACVLFKVTGSYESEAQVAFAHCERMQWAGGRWMIAPGRPPAPAPATWPGTDKAVEAGWRTWTTATPDEGSH